MRRIWKILAVVVFVCTAWTSTANAEIGWFHCTVNKAGPSTLDVFVNLTDTASVPEFTNKWFKVSGNVKKEMLATALTGMALDLRVLVRTDPDAAGFPVISKMYLEK